LRIRIPPNTDDHVWTTEDQQSRRRKRRRRVTERRALTPSSPPRSVRSAVREDGQDGHELPATAACFRAEEEEDSPEARELHREEVSRSVSLLLLSSSSSPPPPLPL